MEIIARSSVRVAPRKVRIVADLVRKLSLDDAIKTLSLLEKRGAVPLSKTLKSAVSNATNNNNLKQENLKIKSIDVLEAPAYKRFHFSTRGRVHPYKRKGSHIKIVLEEKVVGSKPSKLSKENLTQKPKQLESQKSKIFGKEESANKPKSE